jgi:hypothetical protein
MRPTVPLGLTDACRMALRGSGVPMTPPEVRDRLAAIGVDLSVYSNELAAIHTVLRRLHDVGELRLVPRSAGRHAYAWQKPPRVVTVGGDVAEWLRGATAAGHPAHLEEGKPPAVRRSSRRRPR